MSMIECYRLSKASVANRGVKYFVRTLKRTVRLFCYRTYLREHIDAFFAATAVRTRLMAIPEFRPKIYVQQLRTAYHRNSNRADRLRYLQSHFQFLERTHRDSAIDSIYAGRFPVLLYRELDSEIFCKLEFPRYSMREGLLQMAFGVDGVSLYKVVFWFTQEMGEPAVCIGALQGGVASLEANREFTKKFGGLRPQNMALAILRWYAQATGVTRIYALPKARAMSRRIAAETDLDALWREQGAEPVMGSCFVRLLLDTPRKEHSDIPVRKRSMYKKRYEFLDRFRDQAFDHIRSHLLRERLPHDHEGMDCDFTDDVGRCVQENQQITDR